jgi:23S rRNA pseudouridine2604 synthase
MEMPEYPMRINKYLAKRNFCSRREADSLIEKGLVSINGKQTVLGAKVNEDDKVEINTKNKAAIKIRQYFAYYKPIGIITHSPEEGQKGIEDVANFSPEFFPLGRLDKDSHGLIIMTNDGRITDKLLNPKYEHEKEYIVRVNKKINNFFIRHMSDGIDLEDFRTKMATVEKMSEQTFRIILVEGKKHQIRRMCTALGYEVVDLKRVRVLNLKLGSLKPNQKKEIKDEELEIFLKSLEIV